MTGDFTEPVVEDAALDWLESFGWTIKHGLEIAPGEVTAAASPSRVWNER